MLELSVTMSLARLIEFHSHLLAPNKNLSRKIWGAGSQLCSEHNLQESQLVMTRPSPIAIPRLQEQSNVPGQQLDSRSAQNTINTNA